jgi:hypothetical protein
MRSSAAQSSPANTEADAPLKNILKTEIRCRKREPAMRFHNPIAQFLSPLPALYLSAINFQLILHPHQQGEQNVRNCPIDTSVDQTKHLRGSQPARQNHPSGTPAVHFFNLDDQLPTAFCRHTTIHSSPESPAQKRHPQTPVFPRKNTKSLSKLHGTSVKNPLPQNRAKNRPHRKTPCETAPTPQKCSTIHPQQFNRHTVKYGTSRPLLVQILFPKIHNN